MIVHVMEMQIEAEGRLGPLLLTCDNCGGQNKNRFFMLFIEWIVIKNRGSDVHIYFPISSHTKNYGDGVFGLVKQRFRYYDVTCPAEMIDVIEDSGKFNSCIPFVSVF